MSEHTTLSKAGPLLGAFLLCLSGFGLAGPTSPARADDTSSDQVTPVGVDGQGNPLEVSPALAEAATRESAATEGVVEGYSPDGDTNEKIIGPDDRIRFTDTTEYPNRAIVYIHGADGKQRCTGWLVSPDTVVTAGHCVYNPETQRWNFDVEYSPGANGAERPYGTAKATRLWTDNSWINDGNSEQDWGIVKLDRAFPEVGYFGYRWQSASFDDTEVQLRGYPQDRPAGELWGMAGPITESSTYNLYYQMDTVGGQSGSPVFLGDVHRAVAIHTGWEPDDKNRSTRITESLFNIISEIKG
ncbi:MAG: trypsin-like serine protease [Propionibacteriaceae bacterium]|nr:trypsin-like serine protease [Propionibacteriaceae bacterium]